MQAEDIVKLDANENPYGPPPEVLKALGSLKFPHIYPDPESRQLRATLARNHSIPMDQILVNTPPPPPPPPARGGNTCALIACRNALCLHQSLYIWYV